MGWRRRIGLAVVLAGGVLLSGGGAWTEEKAATKPAAGAAQISGTIKTSKKVLRVCAVDREWADVLKTSEKTPKDAFLYEGKFEAEKEGGKFTVGGLLPGRSYDLIMWTEDAAGVRTRWEGACMDYHRPITPAEAATEEDKKWLADFVKDMPSFYDKNRILHLAADHKHATVLVELARTREFHSGKNGEMIYRVELWYFENLFGGWAKDKNTERVLARVRGMGDGFEKNWQFLPALGGIAIDANGKSAAVEIKLPEKADGKNGLAGELP